MLMSVIFTVVLSLMQTFIGIPFSLYKTFIIEEKYGFNKTTIKTFIADLIK
jgi:STE24 endopeptidase